MTSLSRPTSQFHFEPRGLPQSGRVHSAARLHRMDCSCASCTPSLSDTPDRLSTRTKAKLAIAAAIVGSAIAFAIDPAGAFGALRDAVML